VPASPNSYTKEIADDVPRTPQLGWRWWQGGLGQFDQPADQPLRTVTKRQLGSAGRAEQVGNERKVGISDVRKQQRRASRRDDATMDLGRFEGTIDRRRDLDEISITPEPIEEGT
jgi:hypothetical protein